MEPSTEARRLRKFWFAAVGRTASAYVGVRSCLVQHRSPTSCGSPAVTIRSVAAKAATATPNVYSYYADREALLIALRWLAISTLFAYPSAGRLPELVSRPARLCSRANDKGNSRRRTNRVWNGDSGAEAICL
jgi:hypothetical protein